MASASRKILFLYFDPHYLHSAFARSVGADFLSNDFIINWTKTKRIYKKILGFLVSPFALPRGYDIYLSEGPSIIPVVAKKLRLLEGNSKMINFASDPLVYYLQSGVKRGIKRGILLKVFEGTDGFICISSMGRELLSELVDKPVCVADPFILNERYIKYIKITPDLNSHNLLFIAKGPDWFCKGLDLLIESFRIARGEIDDLKLIIIGDWIPQKDWLNDGIEFVGFQRNLAPFLEKSSLYVHIGRGESFGISVLEAMLSGLPAIVSKWTGAKEVVKNLSHDLISDIQPIDVADKIIRYFDMSIEKREALSRRAKSLASEYKEDKKIKLFESKFHKLTEAIEE